jgi:opacity protein-like surface antigen
MLGLAAAALLAASTFAVSSTASAEGKSTLSSGEALGLGDDGQTLRIFKLSNPEEDRLIGKVSGLADGETELEAIDYNVWDGRFYGFAQGTSGENAQVYRLNTKSGAATLVATLWEDFWFTTSHHDLDFKPTDENEFHVTSRDSGGGRYGVFDLDLPFPQADPAFAVDSGRLPYAGGGFAFTNNDRSSTTGTTPFAIDPASRTVKVVLAPEPDPNTCCSTALTEVTGDLGLSAVSSIIGFDILSKVSDGKTTSNTGYASLRSSDTSEPNLYKVDLLTGKASKVDDFDKQIADIAVKQP